MPELRPGPQPSAAPVKLRWGHVLSWALYDFANTIYSALVVSFAITLHVKEYTGVERLTFLTLGASLLVSGLVLPFAGEAADRTGSGKRYLLALTLVTCACCVGMSLADAAWLILALFFVANFTYNSSLPFYDSLMPQLAPRERLGMISGIGVGLGYAGVFFALPVGLVAVAWYGRTGPAHPLRPVFALAGVLFLAFSVPLFLFVPPGSRGRRGGRAGNSLRAVWRRVFVTLRLLPRNRPVLLFLIGNFLLVDSLNMGIIAAAPYMRNVFGLSVRQVMVYLIPFSVSAALLGALGGKVTDRLGPRRNMMLAAVCVMFTVTACAVTRSFAAFLAIFVLLGGYGLSNIWVSGRKLLVELAPAGQLGKYFGLYNVGHKLSIVGSVVFGLLADVRVPGIPAGGYRLGLLAQIGLLVPGLLCIYAVRPHGEEHG